MARTDSTKTAASTRQLIAAWDAPTRVTHWSIAVLVLALWWSGMQGRWEIHILLGDILAGLVTFRMLWGFFGGSTARLSNMIKGPSQLARYTIALLSRKDAWASVGHNPLGGWSAIAMLLSLFVMVISGLCAESLDGLSRGIFARYLSETQLAAAAAVHDLDLQILEILVALHLSAIFFYTLFKRENLISAMIQGRRLLPATSVPLQPASWWRLFAALAIAVGTSAAMLRASLSDIGLGF